MLLRDVGLAEADGGGRAGGHSKETVIKVNHCLRDLELKLPELCPEQPEALNNERL